jgi:transposase
MAKGYSKDLRARAVALVEDGESRREAARVLGLGASTAISAANNKRSAAPYLRQWEEHVPKNSRFVIGLVAARHAEFFRNLD